MPRQAATRDYGGVSASARQADRRRKLLEAGRQLWGGSGLGEVTVRRVSARSQLATRYFYEEFPDRDALLVAIAEQVRDELIDVLVAAGLSEPGDIEDRLRAALTAFLDRITDEPDLRRVFTDVMTGTGPLGELRRQTLDLITALVLEHGPALLDFTPPRPAEMRRGATYLVGGVTHLIDTWALDPHESTTELADICAKYSLAVIRTTPSRPTSTVYRRR
jgi:AcrR family transcriptional regulator